MSSSPTLVQRSILRPRAPRRLLRSQGRSPRSAVPQSRAAIAGSSSATVSRCRGPRASRRSISSAAAARGGALLRDMRRFVAQRRVAAAQSHERTPWRGRYRPGACSLRRSRSGSVGPVQQEALSDRAVEFPRERELAVRLDARRPPPSGRASLARAIVAANIARRSLSVSKLPISTRSSLTTSSGRFAGQAERVLARAEFVECDRDPQALDLLQRRRAPARGRA